MPDGRPNLAGQWAGEQRVLTDPRGISGAFVPLSVEPRSIGKSGGAEAKSFALSLIRRFSAVQRPELLGPIVEGLDDVRRLDAALTTAALGLDLLLAGIEAMVEFETARVELEQEREELRQNLSFKRSQAQTDRDGAGTVIRTFSGNDLRDATKAKLTEAIEATGRHVEGRAVRACRDHDLARHRAARACRWPGTARRHRARDRHRPDAAALRRADRRPRSQVRR